MAATRAFTCITSIEVVPRTVAFLRSLEATDSLTGAACYVLCLDASVYDLLQGMALAKVSLVQVADIPELAQVSAPPARPLASYAYACKPFLMRWAIQNRGAEKILYCDSDLWFVQAPEFLFDKLDTADIVIVGAFISPEASIRDWQRIVNNIQRTGYYNAGFVGCSQRGIAFLDWWADRCAYHTGYDFYRDISSDQKYLNWVPSLFPNVHVVRHYGVNIKLWILESVPMERRPDGTATLGGDDMIFFHFSQNLGNLNEWPPEFYPEVSRYLSELERARIDTGQPYIDMTHRDNRDHKRPLLPKSGKLSFAIKQAQRLPERRAVLGSAVTKALSRATRFLPNTVSTEWALRLLQQWALDGDAADYEAMAFRLGAPTGELVFLGISRLAFYLASVGHTVTIYDPFQGHYNAGLAHLFNPQQPEAERMADVLDIHANLKMERYHANQALDQIQSPVRAYFIPARREADEMAAALGALQARDPAPAFYLLFDPRWPQDYRSGYIQQVKAALAPTTLAGVTRDIEVLQTVAQTARAFSPIS